MKRLGLRIAFLAFSFSLRVADGIVVALPIILAAVVGVIFIGYQNPWLTNFWILTGGVFTSILLGAAIGVVVGRRYVAGRWLTEFERRKAAQWAFRLFWAAGFLIVILAGLSPAAVKLRRTVEATRARIQKEAVPATTRQGQAARNVSRELFAAVEEVLNNSEKSSNKNDQLTDDQRKDAEKVLKAAEKIARDPAAVETVLNKLEKDLTDKSTVTNTKATHQTFARRAPPWFRVFAWNFPLRELFDLNWGSGNRIVKETITKTIRGQPPTAKELESMLKDLKNPADRVKAIELMKEVFAELHRKGEITKDVANRLLTDLQGLEGDQWIAMFRGTLGGNPTETDAAELVNRALKAALEAGPEGNVVFAADAQKAAAEQGLKAIRTNDYKQVWDKSGNLIPIRGGVR